MTAAVADNPERGVDAEMAACERWPLRFVPDSDDDPGWYDCEFVADLEGDLAGPIVEAGTPVEVKACLQWYQDRRGRWWIKRRNHEQLLEADGEYVLAVCSEHEVLRQVLLSATTVDAMIDRWWAAGNGGRDAEEFVQLPWSSVLDGVGGENP